jgi:hypothetical protein
MTFLVIYARLAACIGTSIGLATGATAGASENFFADARKRDGLSVIIQLRRRSCSISIAQVAGGSQRPAASSFASRVFAAFECGSIWSSQSRHP